MEINSLKGKKMDRKIGEIGEIDSLSISSKSKE